MIINMPIAYGVVKIIIMLFILIYIIKAGIEDLDRNKPKVQRAILRAFFGGLTLFFLFNGMQPIAKHHDMGAKKTKQETRKYSRSDDYKAPEEINGIFKDRKREDEIQKLEELKRKQKEANNDFLKFVEE